MRKNKVNFLPKLVYKLCTRGALLAGSKAKKLSNPEKYKDLETNDYDLLVPYNKWEEISLLIPRNSEVNSFGGWKFITKDNDGKTLVEVDIWPDDPINYLTNLPGEIYLFDYIKNRFYCSDFIRLNMYKNEEDTNKE